MAEPKQPDDGLPADPFLEGEPTDGEHYELLSRIYRTMKCVDHGQRAFELAARSGDFELAALLSDAVADVSVHADLLQEAPAKRTLPMPLSRPPRRDVRARAPAL